MEDPSIRTFYWRVEGRSSPAACGLQRIGPEADPRARQGRQRVATRISCPSPVERLRAETGITSSNAPRSFTPTSPPKRSSATGRKARQRRRAFRSSRCRFPTAGRRDSCVDVGQWELARSMLDKVVPAAARDEFVRQWYDVTAAVPAEPRPADAVAFHSRAPAVSRRRRSFCSRRAACMNRWRSPASRRRCKPPRFRAT